jgi:starch synthase
MAGDRMSGIVNGVDPAVWGPEADPYLPRPFSAEGLRGKAATKRAVCAELGLDAARPLLAFVGRLTPEKGAEVLAPGLERILDQTEAAVAVLGSGYAEHEAALREVADRAPSGRATPSTRPRSARSPTARPRTGSRSRSPSTRPWRTGSMAPATCS